MESVGRKLSLTLLKTVSKAVKENRRELSLSDNKDILLLIKDSAPNSDFFFRIEKEEVGQNNAIAVTFTCKPFSDFQNDAKPGRFNLQDFNNKLLEWLRIIHEYKVQKIIDDPVEKQYQEEFYNDF